MKKWQALLVTSIMLALLAVGIWFFWKPLLNFLNVHSELLQGADSLVALIAALLSLISAIFSFLTSRGESSSSAPTLPPQIDTGGGAYIGGDVDTGGGDFIGRDKNIRKG